MSVLHEIRNKEGGTEVVKLTRRTAIHRLCDECCGFYHSEVIKCSSPMCPVYPYRYPGIKDTGMSEASARAGCGFKGSKNDSTD